MKNRIINSKRSGKEFVHKMKKWYIILFFSLLIFPIASADIETLIICTGDQETLIQCVGDSELSFVAETDLKEGGTVITPSISGKRTSESSYTEIIKSVKNVIKIPFVWITLLLFAIFIISYAVYHKQKS